MEVLKLTFIETSQFNDQSIRSYDTDLKKGMLDDALAKISEKHTFSTNTIGTVAANLIRPSGNSGVSNIDGGWGVQRLRFAMVVSTADRNYHKAYNYITGYTDSNDYTISQDGQVLFNPSMRLYFNSISRVSLLLTDDRGTEVYRPKLESHDQILNRNSVNVRDVTAMRPSDVFRRRGLDMEDTTLGGLSGTYSEVRNRVGGFPGTLSLSTRQNNSPTAYLHRTIDTYSKVQATRDQHDYGTGYDHATDSHGEVLLESVDRLSENIISEDPWVDATLKSDTNYLRQGYITYRELLRTNPDLDEDTTVGLNQLNQSRSDEYAHAMSNRGDTMEAIAVGILAGSIPSLMLTAMYSRVEDLIIDTFAQYENEQVIPGIAYPFVDGLDTRNTDDAFIDSIVQTVIRDISRNHSFAVEVCLTCDIDGVMEGEISIDGGDPEYFCVPVFSDALNSNVLSDSFERLDRISNDVLTISETFHQDRVRRSDTNVSTNSKGLVSHRDGSSKAHPTPRW